MKISSIVIKRQGHLNAACRDFRLQGCWAALRLWWCIETFQVYVKKQVLLSCHIQLLLINSKLSCLFSSSLCISVEYAFPLLLTSILVPNRQHPEYEGTECGGKVSPPVIPHRKVGRRDLNTKQHPWWRWIDRKKGEEGQRERRDYREEEQWGWAVRENEGEEEERKRRERERERTVLWVKATKWIQKHLKLRV